MNAWFFLLCHYYGLWQVPAAQRKLLLMCLKAWIKLLGNLLWHIYVAFPNKNIDSSSKTQRCEMTRPSDCCLNDYEIITVSHFCDGFWSESIQVLYLVKAESVEVSHLK